MKTVVFEDTPVSPSKILCVGRNYAAHIEELGNDVPDDMVVFGKPNSAIGDTLYAERDGEPLHYEGEIALLIKGGKAVAAGFGLDLTKRALQNKLKQAGLPWERAKAFDGAALFSPFIRIENDTASLRLQLHIDGELRQQGGVELMMYPPEVILRELARFTTLEDGDIVMTGTPAGVGHVVPGAQFVGEVFTGPELLARSRWLAS